MIPLLKRSRRAVQEEDSRSHSRAQTILNIHFGFHFFGFLITDVFGALYLLEREVPLSLIFAWWAVFFLLRLVLRPFAVKLSERIGVKRVLLLSVLLYIVKFPLYLTVTGVDLSLLLLVFVDALAGASYWTTYQACFAAFSLAGARGREVALREAISHLAHLLAPLIGGVAVGFFGFGSAFILGALAAAAGIVPLFLLPDLPTQAALSKREFFARSNRLGYALYLFNGANHWAQNVGWKVIVFLAVGSYPRFGGLIALATLFQIAALSIVGKRYDQGHGRTIFTIGAALLAVTLLGRAALHLSVPTIVTLDLLFAAGLVLYRPISSSMTYEMAKRSGNPLWYQLFAEGAWDIGSAFTMGSIALYLWSGGKLELTLLWGLPPLLLATWIVRSYYARWMESHPRS